MIERNFVRENALKLQINQFIIDSLRERSIIKTEFKKTPLGERIIIYSTMPGVVVGRKGRNITELTKRLKEEFNLENPQIEVAEEENQDLNPKAIAQKIAYSFERFGPKRFKAVMHKSAEAAMQAGAKGIEIVISGKVPSARAKTWRVYHGYLKKSGDVAVSQVLSAKETAFIKAGAVGITVRIMPPNITLPDEITEIVVEEEIKKEGSSKEESEITQRETETKEKTEAENEQEF